MGLSEERWKTGEDLKDKKIEFSLVGAFKVVSDDRRTVTLYFNKFTDKWDIFSANSALCGDTIRTVFVGEDEEYAYHSVFKPVSYNPWSFFPIVKETRKHFGRVTKQESEKLEEVPFKTLGDFFWYNFQENGFKTPSKDDRDKCFVFSLSVSSITKDSVTTEDIKKRLLLLSSVNKQDPNLIFNSDQFTEDLDSLLLRRNFKN